MDNVKVLQCGESGVCLESKSKAFVSGTKTKIDGNCRMSQFEYSEYGVDLDTNTID